MSIALCSRTRCCSKEMKQLEGELASSRAEHASTRCTLYAAKRVAAEQERQRANGEAKHKLLQASCGQAGGG